MSESAFKLLVDTYGTDANLRPVFTDNKYFQFLKRVSSYDLVLHEVFKLRFSNVAYSVELISLSLVHAISLDGYERWIRLNRSPAYEPHFVYRLADTDIKRPFMSIVPDSEIKACNVAKLETDLSLIHFRLQSSKGVKPVFVGGLIPFSETGKEVNFLNL